DLHRRLIEPRETRDHPRCLLLLNRGLAVVCTSARWSRSDDGAGTERRILAADRQALRRTADTRSAPGAEIGGEPGWRMGIDPKRLHRERSQGGALAGVEPHLPTD